MSETHLYRAEATYSEGYPCICTGIDMSTYTVARVTECYYIIKEQWMSKEKRVYKGTMKFAQLTKEDAVEALMQRLRSQVKWWEARTKWAKLAIGYIEEHGSNCAS